jgi:hypothetical protein
MKKKFKLETCKIAVFNVEAYRLAMDLEILGSLAREDPDDGFVSQQALFTGNHILNLLQAGKAASVSQLLFSRSLSSSSSQELSRVDNLFF